MRRRSATGARGCRPPVFVIANTVGAQRHFLVAPRFIGEPPACYTQSYQEFFGRDDAEARALELILVETRRVQAPDGRAIGHVTIASEPIAGRRTREAQSDVASLRNTPRMHVFHVFIYSLALPIHSFARLLYRDYTHQALAKIRFGKGYCSPPCAWPSRSNFARKAMHRDFVKLSATRFLKKGTMKWL